MIQLQILYPQQDSTVYGDELKFRYKVLNNLEKYKLSKIVFVINDGDEITSNIGNEYTLQTLKTGSYEIKGYLLNKNNVKIDDTDFFITSFCPQKNLNQKHQHGHLLKQNYHSLYKMIIKHFPDS